MSLSLLQPYIDRQVLIITSDGRTLTGRLLGFDQATNIILSEAEERIFVKGENVISEAIGLYLLRGENIAIIGEIDQDIEDKINWENVTGEPIKETKVFA
ncbi:U6 snRNP-associated protein Lsm8 [Taphrina deformans PYCC 5710]|uniref:LSM2-LSM8 complex subunit LSM8 n=1 Tax=Taphrina deformans (strain PYCC 5710 / ATCC 11124 / CBS 356.35 / IMI 108563 / JCM 9778 / NBRC 8474) TaxID=1097556 RepID=R4XBZ1_TAPDE|nr:U6 snRNP-associated protein Lsm8 [Taphrina deformans PYCC 5710]|eukprot:CCG83080.1 U6 snRNP-associated protein Lsm8 [Taphrina deformans PYCC 5710]